MSDVDLNDLKPLKISKEKGRFRTFTNGSIIEGENMPQPYLGKPITINMDIINSVYPAEDNIGTSIHSTHGQTWKVLENHETVRKRLSE
tara:strand:+ start:247 stop:513 length:267 start_codon:yes stop_codon:yes gene_type:complete